MDNDIMMAKLSLWYYLRYKLNKDCLLELFEYLNVLDLMRICDLDTDDDQFFTVLIRERVIGEQLIDLWSRFDDWWPIKKIFEKFGPFIKRLRVPMQSNCLNYILRNIFKYSAPDTLTQIEFVKFPTDYYVKEPLNPNLFEKAIPYFRSVKHVLIDIDPSYDCAMSAFYAIFLNSSNLKSLEVNERDDKVVQLKWRDLISVSSLNLTKFVVCTDSPDGIDLARFIQKLPHLEVFILYGERRYPAISEALVKFCPKLQNYGDYCGGILSEDPHYYDFLKEFDHLTHASLTTSSCGAHDIKSTLQTLAQKNQLEKLIIYPNTAADMTNAPIDDEPYFEYFNGFSSLKNLQFIFFHEFGFHSEFKDFRKCEPFFRNLMTSMHQLKKIKLIGKLSVHNLSKMFQFSHQIHELDISQQHLHHMPAEVRRIRKFFQQIVDTRRNEGFDDPTPRITMNSEQAREFKTIKNIDQVIKIVIQNEPLTFSNHYPFGL